MGTVVVCQSNTRVLKISDLEQKVTLRPYRLKNQRPVVYEFEKKELLCTGKVKQLKERPQSQLKKEQESYQRQEKDFKAISVDEIIKPSYICQLGSDMIACSCDSSRQVPLSKSTQMVTSFVEM